MRFLCDFNDWEVESVVDFLQIMESNISSTESGDRVRWRLKKNGNFNIRPYYNML